MVRLFLLLAFFFSSFAFATPSGYERGNGGSFVVCGEQSLYGQGVFSLDRLEGESSLKERVPYRLLQFSDENGLIKYILDQIEKASPIRGEMYKRWLRNIMEERRFVDGSQIQPLNDGDVIFVPLGCSLRQAAVFVTDMKQTKMEFLFDKDLWERATPLDRAFLVLHEIVYREARLPENGHINSMASRHFTFWLMINIDKLTQDGLLAKLKEINFRLADYGGVAISLTLSGAKGVRRAPLLQYSDEGRIQKAIPYRSFDLRLNDSEFFRRRCDYEPSEYGFIEYIEFYPEYVSSKVQIKEIVIEDPLFAAPSSDCSLYGGNNFLSFDVNGDLIEASRIIPRHRVDFSDN